MEVVSPLTFARANQSGKRRFGSPIPSVSTDNNAAPEDFDMMDDCSATCSGYGFQAAKRRKRFSNEGGAKENWSLSPFVPASSRSPHAVALPSVKRTRTPQQDEASAQKLQELQRMVEQQAAEIQRLKSEKESAQAAASQLSSQHAKVENENKILKRAVAIQQDRQHQMTAVLEGAKQFKVQAEDRIRRLEQMNLTLQYQLQANSTAGNDFMGFRPPDVY
mmetsp:Transcript_43995/g.93686  ORF Transcript_43995/g.93686 Transcript_43995/m.93686 type:complete len:220 (-) Transcript_43995:280-939(-)|eukprot:CAMPEP_0172551328 /NCGR_PEP_ID=MMETSP1067-20121228/38166_1 /TAXON_ID=265564 ORGANISM="Thalassiosira punctigera, Strain Tpunct2005C2" /NCGR_SAMPLE_ID=MMETSP1067 /ASSEMBLY_ACC=CAM_ASM_000444 /LENGTH=219 /DNA_ID=CAMNT_0013339097 /DNA_START=158 /DNA_END=820 /DNA_ORIENTATION=-